ncbi:hypothetical protein [Flavivirga jejuensis]|uniref:Lipoprotein n=1 Tax=Flavivirga jejuensis TaxID=870487 RepID=A0ABT8WM29_9FLAO|nr:hypothetical protein [Flavivirga jejuensis]MDO5974110.1 hypothetical protein [Flavivirga jejuensis]
MKKLNLILLSFLVLVSCSNDDDSSPSLNINGTYTYSIPNCDNGGNYEIHCELFVIFVNDTQVNPISITGGDIVYQTDYTINNNVVKFNKSSDFNFDVSFEIIDNTTLKRIEDSTIWVKSE